MTTDKTYPRLSAFTHLSVLLLLSIVVIPAGSVSAASLTTDAILPAVYSVSGLNTGGTLNVRIGPSSGTKDIGDISEDGSPIEILEIDSTGKWGRILWEEGNGWVFMKYMQPYVLESLKGTAVPVGLSCLGTEPAWSAGILSQQDIRVQFLTDDSLVESTINRVTRLAEWQEFPVALKASNKSSQLSAIVYNASCSDGMSEREYGRAIDLTINQVNPSKDNGTSLSVLSGCCFMGQHEKHAANDLE